MALQRHSLIAKPEAATVQVQLLCGQRLEVSCRSDSTAGEIFEAVVTHSGLAEHVLHGLSVCLDGEHFFLEPEAKLSKTAPPGWGRKKSLAARNVYTLHLRLRYYPQELELVKTPKTVHEVYLQLRRDFVQEERLQTDKETAFQLSALMLQAEYGDQPTPSGEERSANAYFQLDHYMPNRHMMSDVGGDDRVRSVLAEIHRSHYAGLSQEDAEIEFIRMCQKQREYGLHFYRLYKHKPSSNLVPTPLGDPDTGTLLWVGISAAGLGIFQDRAGERRLQDRAHWHSWIHTQSIKFDKKKFVIVPTAEDEEAAKRLAQTYFTDSNKKSTYFVRFAMSQHRFNMRMRAWTATLERRTRSSREGTAAAGTNGLPNGHHAGVPSPSSKSPDSGLPDDATELEERTMERAKAPSPVAPPRRSAADATVEEPSRDRPSLLVSADTSSSLSQSLAARFHSASQHSFREFPVRLDKDPQFGLGDMITTVNGTSLEGKNRHDAVDIVKSSNSSSIEIFFRDILRIGELEAGSSEDEADSAHHTSASTAPVYRSQDIHSAMLDAVRREEAEEEKEAAPAPRRPSSARSSRSSFGKDGEAEPSPQAPIYPVEPAPIYAGLHDSDSEESTLAQSQTRATRSTTQDSTLPPDFEADEERRQRSQNLPPAFNSAFVTANETKTSSLGSWNSMEEGERKRTVSNDWVEGIAMEEREPSEEEGEVEEFEVTLAKEGGSLGLKIAGGSKGTSRIYVKALVGGPALACPDLRPGDRLTHVNGTSTLAATHDEVVDLLKAASSPVTLGLSRPRSQPSSPASSRQETELVVELEKPASGSLGLSLARPAGGEGIYVRAVTAGSAADVDGRIKVGDRLWSVNDESVADATPLEVVHKLKQANGLLTLTLKR